MKDLVEIIKANPGCTATIDNDYWVLHAVPPKPLHEMSEDEHEDWYTSGQIAHSGEVDPLGDGGYGCGACYGGDILQALAIIVGISIESV